MAVLYFYDMTNDLVWTFSPRDLLNKLLVCLLHIISLGTFLHSFDAVEKEEKLYGQPNTTDDVESDIGVSGGTCLDLYSLLVLQFVSFGL